MAMAVVCKAKVNEDLVCPQSLFNISIAILECVSKLWYIEDEGKRLSAVSTSLPLSVLSR